jgi:replicative DNA helicase
VNIHQAPVAVHEIFGGPLPHNIEAEQCLLGAILNNNEASAAVESLVDEEDFFEPIHQEIFRISRDLIREGKLVNPITLKTFFWLTSRS